MKDDSEVEQTSVTFEAEVGPPITLEGLPPHLLGSPDKLREIMETLELPKGTNARVRITTSNVIVR